MSRRISALLLVLLLCAAWVVPSGAADGSREAARMRLISLETLLSAKRALLKAKWGALSQVDSQLSDLYASDVASSGDQDRQTPARAKELFKNAAKRQSLEDQRYEILQSMQEIYMEMGAIQDEANKAREDLQEAQQVLEGRWSLVLMPAGTKGDVYLTQNGTLVTGDYKLDNGQAGSLQGTYVNGVLVIERIDARYGKMGRFEGSLSKDGQSVKGSWYSYDFASGQPITGAFSLDRVQEGSSP